MADDIDDFWKLTAIPGELGGGSIVLRHTLCTYELYLVNNCRLSSALSYQQDHICEKEIKDDYTQAP